MILELDRMAAELRPEPPSVETDGDDEEGEGHG